MSDTTKVSATVHDDAPPVSPDPVTTTDTVLRMLAISAAVFGTVSLVVDTNIGFGFAVAGFLTGLFNRYAFGPTRAYAKLAKHTYVKLATYGVVASLIGLVYALLVLNNVINEATLNSLVNR